MATAVGTAHKRTLLRTANRINGYRLTPNEVDGVGTDTHPTAMADHRLQPRYSRMAPSALGRRTDSLRDSDAAGTSISDDNKKTI